MSLSPLSNGDSGFDARTKINAGLSALNALVSPAVYYVDTANGDDDTGAVGNPALPYATAQAAFDDWQAAGIAGRMHLMRTATDAGGITLAASMMVPLHITGEGHAASKLGGITADGAAGDPGPEAGGGQPGAPGYGVSITSDWSVNMGAITGRGGAGGAGGTSTIVNTNGGQGGDSSLMRLFNVMCEYVSLTGGSGGAGSSFDGNDVGGDGGACSQAVLIGVHSRHVNGIQMAPGGGGSGSIGGSAGADAADATVVRCVCEAGLAVAATTGIVSHCLAYSYTLTVGLTESFNATNAVPPTWP